MATISRIVFGTMRLGDPGKYPVEPSDILERIKGCLSLGITSFDLADIYGEYTYEELFGKAIALEPSIRSKIQIVTKCGILYPNKNRPSVTVKHYNSSPSYIIECANRSLENIGTSYIDLFLLHRPDPLMSADEVVGAFKQLHQEGKVHHFGVSNFTVSQFELLASRMANSNLPPLKTNQIECSVLHTTPIFDGSLDLLQKVHATPMIWSPLAGGANSWPRGGGLFGPNKSERDIRVVNALEKVAKEIGPSVTIDMVAYAWLLALPSKPSLVVGTNDRARFKAAVESTKISLGREQWFYILEASAGEECP